jgi:hypothetical protein
MFVLSALSCMPRFYFDLREGATHVLDPDGAEFSTQAAVAAEAAQVAMAVAQDHFTGSELQLVVVEVHDGEGAGVLTATASLKIERAKSYVWPGPPYRH